MTNSEINNTHLNNRTEAEVYLIRHCSSQPDDPNGTEYTITSTSIEPDVLLFDETKAWSVRATTKKNGSVQAGLLGHYGYYLAQDGVLLKRVAEGPLEATEHGIGFRKEVVDKYREMHNAIKASR